MNPDSPDIPSAIVKAARRPQAVRRLASMSFFEREVRGERGHLQRRGLRLPRVVSTVELVAIGIGHDVTHHYKRTVTITDAEQLGGAITEQLAELFDGQG